MNRTKTQRSKKIRYLIKLVRTTGNLCKLLGFFRYATPSLCTWGIEKSIVSGPPVAIGQRAPPYGQITMGRDRERET
ncbi:MAG: hypothetical protein JSW12_03135 [Deltaproteobacteria bacterium]|nr:MAG: hypothetical protein JSW12_03135 [Deltaproteobacteria bacterium]